jgi:hypothetical protein
MDIPIEALAAVGTAIAAVVGALWWQVRDRVRALERANLASIQRETESRHIYVKAQEERIKASNNFAEAMRDMAEKTTRALERNTAVAEKNQEVLSRLMDHLVARPCLIDHGEPRPHTLRQEAAPALQPRRTPSSTDLPSVDPPTDQHGPQDARWRTPR